MHPVDAERTRVGASLTGDGRHLLLETVDPKKPPRR